MFGDTEFVDNFILSLKKIDRSIIYSLMITIGFWCFILAATWSLRLTIDTQYDLSPILIRYGSLLIGSALIIPGLEMALYKGKKYTIDLFSIVILFVCNVISCILAGTQLYLDFYTQNIPHDISSAHNIAIIAILIMFSLYMLKYETFVSVIEDDNKT